MRDCCLWVCCGNCNFHRCYCFCFCCHRRYLGIVLLVDVFVFFCCVRLLIQCFDVGSLFEVLRRWVQINYIDCVTILSFGFNCFEEFYAGDKFWGVLLKPQILIKTFDTCIAWVVRFAGFLLWCCNGEFWRRVNSIYRISFPNAVGRMACRFCCRFSAWCRLWWRCCFSVLTFGRRCRIIWCDGWLSAAWWNLCFGSLVVGLFQRHSSCLACGLPLVLYPVFGFALSFFSVVSVATASSLRCCCSFRDIFLGRPDFSSCRNVSCWKVIGCLMSKKRRNGPFLQADLYAT